MENEQRQADLICPWNCAASCVCKEKCLFAQAEAPSLPPLPLWAAPFPPFKCSLFFQMTHIIYRMWIHVCRNSSCSAKGSVHEICLRSQPTLTVQSDVQYSTVLLRACITFAAALLTVRPALNVRFCLFDFISLFSPSSFPAARIAAQVLWTWPWRLGLFSVDSCSTLRGLILT